MKLLVLSDIHSNYVALKTILENERYDLIAFAGDIVDYGPNPVECIDIIREYADYKVMGNHDAAAAYGIDCYCSYKTKDLSIETRSVITTPSLNAEDKQFLKQLPKIKQIDIDSISFTLVHASPKDYLYDYILPDDTEKLDDAINIIKTDFLIIGHSHHQFSTTRNNVIVVNPGSVGQPRDGNPKAAYAIIDTTTKRVELKRQPYDIEKVIEGLKKYKNVLKKESLERLIRILKLGKIV
ncbi:MAG: metallophosphoesterase family protein [Candidatus Asgardarchaeia archaeon]